jgi:hypothetical protein
MIEPNSSKISFTIRIILLIWIVVTAYNSVFALAIRESGQSDPSDMISIDRNREQLPGLIFRVGLSRFDDVVGPDFALIPSLWTDSIAFVGIGLGWQKADQKSWVSALACFRMKMSSKRIAPVLFSEFGYSFGGIELAADSSLSGVTFGLGAGIAVRLENRTDLLFGIGLKRQPSKRRISDSIPSDFNLNMGISFRHDFRPTAHYRNLKSDISEVERPRLSIRAGMGIGEGEAGWVVSVVPMKYLNSNPMLSAGIGLSHENFDDDSFTSLFLFFRETFLPGEISPLLSAEIGYSFVRVDRISTTEMQGLMFAIGTGVSIPIPDQREFLLEIGYKLQRSVKYHLSFPLPEEPSTESVGYNIVRITGGISF